MTTSERATADGEVVLATIAAGTAATAGEAFFETLVAHVARALEVRGAWVTEWLPETGRLRALSFWLGDGYHGDYEYVVAGTPCEAVVHERRLVHVPEDVVRLFPRDPDLAPLGAVSYLGVPLLDTDESLLGHVAVIHDRPLPATPRAEAILRIFAARAATELQRLRREQALRAREAQLSRLLEGTADAWLELDEGRDVTQANGAARRLLGGDPVGLTLDALLGPPGVAAADGLLSSAPPAGPTWLPEGSILRGPAGEVPIEGTLATYTSGGRRYLALVARSVAARLAAEREIRALTDEARDLREELGRIRGDLAIVGESPAILGVIEAARKVAVTDTTVLVTGETGTGKELVAHAIHRLSRRASGRLVKVNCAAIPAGLQESELFGHEKGAFTGATERRDGRFTQAHGGTLFLDEVGELPLDLQAKLLRVLQEGELEKVGGSRTERVDVRIVAATHRDLAELVERGAFREDLFYRLHVFPIRVPPLRDRGDDVLLIATSILEALGRQRGISPRLSADARARLLAHRWPGNVRELRNVLERGLVIARDGRTVELDDVLPSPVGPGGAPTAPARAPSEVDRILTEAELRALERRNLERALAAAGGKISGPGGAAERLGVKPNTLASRLKALGLGRRT